MHNEKIELLSPAKDKLTAFSAINEGADAVYMGASLFGARSKAGNSIEDIEQVALYAHKFGAKLYIALNTILTDEQLSQAIDLSWQLYEAKVDALIIQDMGFMHPDVRLKMPPISLHASTQCNINTLEKAIFLEKCGFETLVLARELSLEQIANIAKNVSCKIECFVHGALCVGLSGQCYLSWAIGKRSANKGVCAQPCRLKYSLCNKDEQKIQDDGYFLSLKDMNRSEFLLELINAGVCSFKIEGRLKDINYVKNVTAFYSQKLDEILKNNPHKQRASFGRVKRSFLPCLEKSFNRGFTDFYLKTKEDKSDLIGSPETPKSKGEYLGTIKKFLGKSFIIDFDKAKKFELNTGDGLYIENLRDNKNQGEQEFFGAYILECQNDKITLDLFKKKIYLQENAKVWRNKNIAFERDLKQDSQRKISSYIYVKNGQKQGDKFSLIFEIKAEHLSYEFEEFFEEKAQNVQKSLEQIKNALSKTGESMFFCKTVFFDEKINLNNNNVPFIKISKINEIRRTLCSNLEILFINNSLKNSIKEPFSNAQNFYYPNLKIDNNFKLNILNNYAFKFYEKALEQTPICAIEQDLDDLKDKVVLESDYCLLRQTLKCKKLSSLGNKEPIMLVLNDKQKFELSFDCKNCKMRLILRT